jgi:hypothetical protein
MNNDKKDGCVYFIKDNACDAVKIGMSSNNKPKRRFDSFLTYAPYGGVLLGYIISCVPKKLETILHEKYNKRRIDREWFNLTIKESLDIINSFDNSVNLLEIDRFLEIERNEISANKVESIKSYIKNKALVEEQISILVLCSQMIEINTISEMARMENKTPRGIKISNQYKKINIGKQVFAIKGISEDNLPF